MYKFKQILLVISSIINLPLAILTTFGIIWFSLPNLQTLMINDWNLTFLNNTLVFWVTLSSGIISLTLYILIKIFSKYQSAKFRNFMTHLITWLIALVAIGLAVTTFILTEISEKEFMLQNWQKISIGVCFVLMFIFHIFSNKISKIVNRKIQSYENAKELNVVGRSSIIFTNILKLLEILFPEVIVLVLICSCLGWNVATSFVIVLVAMLIPMIGNIDCDFNTRAEIKRLNQIKEDKFAEKVADNMRGE